MVVNARKTPVSRPASSHCRGADNCVLVGTLVSCRVALRHDPLNTVLGAGHPPETREALAYRSHESVLIHVQNPGVSLTPPPGRVPTARPLPGWV